MKKILVIGGNGMLGSEIIRQAAGKGWNCTAVYQSGTSNIPPNCQKIQTTELKNCKDEYDIVFITAGNFTGSHRELLETNVNILLICTDLFRSARLVFVSSINVYGLPTGVLNEQSAFNRPNTYGTAKISGEFIVSGHSSFAIVRPSVILGKSLSQSSFVGRLLSIAANRDTITLFGEGKRRQDYVSLTDVARICIEAGVRDNNGIVLAVSGTSVSNRQIAERLAEISGCGLEYTGEDNSPDFVFDASASNEFVSDFDRKHPLEVIENIYRES